MKFAKALPKGAIVRDDRTGDIFVVRGYSTNSSGFGQTASIDYECVVVKAVSPGLTLRRNVAIDMVVLNNHTNFSYLNVFLEVTGHIRTFSTKTVTLLSLIHI